MFFVACLIFIFFVIRFPWSEYLEKSLRDFQKQSSATREIVFDDLKIKTLPPGLLFKNLSFVYKNKRNYLDSLFVSIAWKDWLAFKRTFKFKLNHGHSKAILTFRKKKILSDEDFPDSDNREMYFIRVFSNHINLKDLESLYPNMLGQVRSQFFYKGFVQETESILAELSLNGENIQLSTIRLNTFLGPLNLPPINWTQVNVEAQVKEGELIFEKVELGSAKDNLKIKMRGSGAVSYFRRFFLSSYNIELEIDMDKDMEFSFLDLMFSGYKKDKGSFYRYSVRLIGQGSQIPKIEKLESFN